MEKLKVLLSAYACEPGKGSEPSVGWNWAKHLCGENDITVITRSNNRPHIERSGETWIHNVTWIYSDLPRWAQWLKKRGFGTHLYYVLWQYGAYRKIKEMMSQGALSIDIVHHVTFGTYWLPSWMGKLAVPFVFGPVGGGEETPIELLQSLTPAQQRYEKRRNFSQRLFYRLFRRLVTSDNVLLVAGTDETAKKMLNQGCKPCIHQHRATPCVADVRNSKAVSLASSHQIIVFPQSGLSEDEKACFSTLPRKKPHAPFTIMSMGRLEHWKGNHLGIQAFAKILKQCPHAEYWISSEGRERKRLERLAKTHDCGTQVKFLGKLPTLQGLYERLAQCDVLLHPALHETFGVACLEAMALQKPVVCFNHGGPALLIGTRDIPLPPNVIETQEWVMADCGIAVKDGSPQETVDRLAEALLTFANDTALCKRTGESAQNRIHQKFSWPSLATQMHMIYLRILTAKDAKVSQGTQRGHDEH